MKFSEGRIILNEKLLALTPEPNRMGLDQKWVEAIAKAVPIENPKMHFDRVKSQIFG